MTTLLKKGIEALKKKEALTISFSKEELEWAKEWSDDKWDDFKRFVDNSDSIVMRHGAHERTRLF